MINRLRSSKPFIVMVSTIALLASLTLYSLDFARADTYGLYSDQFKYEDIGDLSFMMGVFLSSMVLVWKLDHLSLVKFQRLVAVASLVLAVTILPNYMLYQKPGMPFNCLRTIQGSLVGALSTASLLSTANTATHSEIWWTMLLPCCALSLAGRFGLTCFTKSVDTLKLMPYLATIFTIVGVGMLPIQQQSYYSPSEKKVDPGILNPEGSAGSSLFKQVPNISVNLCQALLISFEISNSFLVQCASVWDLFEELRDIYGSQLARKYLAVASICFALLLVGCALLSEIFGTFINKRLGRVYHTFLVLLVGLPHIIDFCSGIREPDFIEYLSGCSTVVLWHMLAVLTPVVARLASSSYGLSHITRGKVFALFMGVYALAHVIKVIQDMAMARIIKVMDKPLVVNSEIEKRFGLDLRYFCYIACDVLPAITPRIARKLKRA